MFLNRRTVARGGKVIDLDYEASPYIGRSLFFCFRSGMMILLLFPTASGVLQPCFSLLHVNVSDAQGPSGHHTLNLCNFTECLLVLLVPSADCSRHFGSRLHLPFPCHAFGLLDFFLVPASGDRLEHLTSLFLV